MVGILLGYQHLLTINIHKSRLKNPIADSTSNHYNIITNHFPSNHQVTSSMIFRDLASSCRSSRRRFASSCTSASARCRAALEAARRCRASEFQCSRSFWSCWWMDSPGMSNVGKNPEEINGCGWKPIGKTHRKSPGKDFPMAFSETDLKTPIILVWSWHWGPCKFH